MWVSMAQGTSASGAHLLFPWGCPHTADSPGGVRPSHRETWTKPLGRVHLSCMSFSCEVRSFPWRSLRVFSEFSEAPRITLAWPPSKVGH